MYRNLKPCFYPSLIFFPQTQTRMFKDYQRTLNASWIIYFAGNCHLVCQCERRDREEHTRFHRETSISDPLTKIFWIWIISSANTSQNNTEISYLMHEEDLKIVKQFL